MGTISGDRSNGYEGIAADYITMRGSSAIGACFVRDWAAMMLPAGAEVLELGCGHGAMTQVLIDTGCKVSVVDASETMLAAVRQRFPAVATECNSVEESDFYGRAFDGVLAWGLMFLLSEDVQRALIHKVAWTLKGGGMFLFTSPKPACTWLDVMTGLPSLSLGADVYREVLSAAGLLLVEERQDEGQNNYYFCLKTSR